MAAFLKTKAPTRGSGNSTFFLQKVNFDLLVEKKNRKITPH